MSTTYTFAAKTPASLNVEGASGSHYMNQPIDGARIAIQGIGNGPMTMAATTATVVNSPLAVPSANAFQLTMPESAIQVSFITPSMAQGIKVSEVNATMTTYFLIPGGTVFQNLDIANCANLYLQSAAGTIATISFYFTLV